MNRVLILISFLFTVNFSFSQKQGQALIDSIEQELPKIKNILTKSEYFSLINELEVPRLINNLKKILLTYKMTLDQMFIVLLNQL